MEQIVKAYYIQEIELAVLLTALGQKQLYGYKLQSIDTVEDQQIDQALFAMARKKIITPGADSLIISGEYRSLLQGIMNASQLFVAADREQKYPELYLYMSDKVVVLQSHGQSGTMLKLEMWERSEAVERLMEWGFRIQSSLQESALYYGKESANKTDSPEFYDLNKEQLLGKREINLLLLDLDIAKRRKNGQILVLRDGVEDQIIVEDQKEMIRYHYSVQRMTEVLSQHMGGVR